MRECQDKREDMMISSHSLMHHMMMQTITMTINSHISYQSLILIVLQHHVRNIKDEIII